MALDWTHHLKLWTREKQPVKPGTYQYEAECFPRSHVHRRDSHHLPLVSDSVDG